MEPSSDQKMGIQVRSQDGDVLFCKCNGNTKVMKVLLAYCKKRQIEYNAVQFLYEGNRFPVRKTIDELNMKDGAEIEAFMQMDGGGSCKGL